LPVNPVGVGSPAAPFISQIVAIGPFLAPYGIMLGQRSSADSIGLRRPGRAQAGYSFVELVITTAMILIVSALAAPSFMNYYRSARVRAGADVVKTYLNEGRQLAIRGNVPVCVKSTSSAIQFLQTNCTGTAIQVTGLSTSSSTVRLPENISLSTSSAIFTNLGAANPGATYTVTDTVSGRQLTVTVAGSGRVTTP
jgi:Tfp pilus assembly protein FimT